MKKFFSLLLVVVMLLSMSTTAFAAGNGSITIYNAVAGETYTIYRLLDLESYNSESGAYAYKANSAWESWLKTQTTYLSFDDQDYVTWVDGADAADFAKAAKEYATTNGIANQETATATSTTVEFTGLDFGYYLVDTTLGTLCSLDTTDPSVTIEEKNEKPLIEKAVEEDSTSGNYGDTDDADIEQVVNFKTTITAYKGAEGYIVHDVMSRGLTLNQDSTTLPIKVTGPVKSVAEDGTVTYSSQNLTKDTQYTIEYNVNCTGKNNDNKAEKCSFHIIFRQDYLDTLDQLDEKGATITIFYSATLNENAVVGLYGNPNNTRLQYSTDNWTEWDETVTYTWDVDVLKYANGEETKVLEGAKFVLLNNDKKKVATFETVTKTINGEEEEFTIFKKWTDVPTDEGAAWPTGAELTTDANGKIEVDGLDADTYYLRETQAPAGYNKLASDKEVKITGAKENGDTLSYTTHVEKVNNQSGTVLPDTGAEGTMMFITIGSLIAMVAVVFMVTRKKMSIYER